MLPVTQRQKPAKWTAEWAHTWVQGENIDSWIRHDVRCSDGSSARWRPCDVAAAAAAAAVSGSPPGAAGPVRSALLRLPLRWGLNPRGSPFSHAAYLLSHPASVLGGKITQICGKTRRPFGPLTSHNERTAGRRPVLLGMIVFPFLVTLLLLFLLFLLYRTGPSSVSLA